ncbi:TPA: hypothetical protein ACSP2A_004327 [Aeromonas hydrophila]
MTNTYKSKDGDTLEILHFGNEIIEFSVEQISDYRFELRLRVLLEFQHDLYHCLTQQPCIVTTTDMDGTRYEFVEPQIILMVQDADAQTFLLKAYITDCHRSNRGSIVQGHRR